MSEAASARGENTAGPRDAAPPSPLLVLLELSRRARKAATTPELQFMVVNDSHALVPYRQSALWFKGRGVTTLSGVVQIEANAPYVRWLGLVFEALSLNHVTPAVVTANQLPAELAAEWAEWLPAQALWMPWPAGESKEELAGGVLLARDIPFTPQDVGLLSEWLDLWVHAWRAKFRRSPLSVQKLGWRLLTAWSDRQSRERKGWRPGLMAWMAGVLLLGVIPVPLTVLAPAELVAAQPFMVRAPIDGVLGEFAVQPNQIVQEGQLLFTFDEALIRSKLEVAYQELSTAQAEYRQNASMALRDDKARFALAGLTGRIDEKQAEVDYLQGQLGRTQVRAQQDGVAMFDDPVEWVGKPVSTGERIMRLASLDDVEVEAWLPLGDAIDLSPGAAVKLYLNTSPLDPVSAKLRYLAHDAVQRPDGTYAYRVRAILEEKTKHRVGLTGNARLSGEYVPLIYWLLRKPLAVVRNRLGI